MIVYQYETWDERDQRARYLCLVIVIVAGCEKE